MSDVLAVFGSGSDSGVYTKLMALLKESGVDAELRICSAHRSPKMLKKMAGESDASLFIAGAGLSAALPGAIASHTVKPVIGIPVAANYSGLDALLSTAQMPPGFPVLSAGVEAIESAASGAEFALEEKQFVKILDSTPSGKTREKIEKAVKKTKSLGLSAQFIEKMEGESFDSKRDILVNATRIADFGELKVPGALVLNVPMMEESEASEALEFLEKSGNGLWLGLNRVDNALIAAAEVIALYNKGMGKKILKVREEMEKKNIEADKKESKRFG